MAENAVVCVRVIPKVEESVVNYSFRTKPVVIQAFQMTFARRYNDVDWPEWLHNAWPTNVYPNPIDPDGHRLLIVTTRGPVKVSWNDWIIRDTQGNLSLCNSDIFESAYEAVA